MVPFEQEGEKMPEEKPDISEPKKATTSFFQNLNNHHVLEGFELSEAARPQGMTANLNEFLEAVRSLKEDLLKPEQKIRIETQAKKLRDKLQAEVGKEGWQAILQEARELEKLGKKIKKQVKT